MSKRIDYSKLFTKRSDGRYVGTYTDETGRHFVYDRDPERLWHRIHNPKPEEVVLFDSVVEDWEHEHMERISYKTAEAYAAPVRRLKDQFGKCAIESITASDISAFLSDLGKRGYSKRTVQMHRDILNMIFNKAIVDGKTRFNPVGAAKAPRNLSSTRRELPSDEAIQAIRDSIGAFSLFAKVCLYAGLRRGEALALRYEDIDLKEKLISVTKAIEFVGNNPHIKEPKTENGYRKVILLDVLADAIPKGTGYLFSVDGVRPLTKTQYRIRWSRYCKEIGFDITAHQLRHGFATILYEAGIPDKDAQDMLGHSTITLTRNIYTHIRQERRDETANRLNEFLSMKQREA